MIHQVLNGAAANTDIPLTPAADVQIGPGARNVVAVLKVSGAGAVTDVTSQVRKVTRQAFQLTADSSATKLVVIFTHAQ